MKNGCLREWDNGDWLHDRMGEWSMIEWGVEHGFFREWGNEEWGMENGGMEKEGMENGGMENRCMRELMSAEYNTMTLCHSL